MNRVEAIEVLNTYDMSENNDDTEFKSAIALAIKAIEQVGCLTDRPCSVCRFKTENGCNRFECVFKGV